MSIVEIAGASDYLAAISTASFFALCASARALAAVPACSAAWWVLYAAAWAATAPVGFCVGSALETAAASRAFARPTPRLVLRGLSCVLAGAWAAFGLAYLLFAACAGGPAGTGLLTAAREVVLETFLDFGVKMPAAVMLTLLARRFEAENAVFSPMVADAAEGRARRGPPERDSPAWQTSRLVDGDDEAAERGWGGEHGG